MVSSGPSSISMQMTYDKTRFNDAVKKITGNELKPDDIINGSSGPGGPSEVRYRARVAFSTVEDTLKNLEAVHNRRKALICVSDGYDFTPFQDARLGLMRPDSPFAQNELVASAKFSGRAWPTAAPTIRLAISTGQKQSEEFADADLARELWDLTRTANRGERDDVHDSTRAAWLARCPTSTRTSILSNGASSSGSLRTACACSPRRRAVSPS